MVNQVILDYLSRYSGMYPIEDLKKNIISTGYSLEEVNEAARFLGLEKDSENVETPLSGFQALEQRASSKTGFKWMKLAGIIGVIFLILGITGSVASIIIPFFYEVPSFDAESLNNISSFLTNPIFIIIALILTLLFPLALIFFFIGFAKMGKLGESKLLRFSSRTFIILIILLLVLALGSIILTLFFGEKIIETMVNTASSGGGLNVGSIDSNNVVIDDYSNSLIGSAINVSGADLGITGYILIIIFSAIILLFFLNTILFFMGLIKIGKRVRFAKLAGVFGLVLFVLYILLTAGLILNPLLLIAITSSGFGIFFIGSILSSLICLVLLFLNLTLFNGSEKFESS